MQEVKNIDSNSCREIYIILNKLELFYKLPEALKDYITQNQNLSYPYQFDKNLPLFYQIDNEKTKACLSYLYLKYINDSADEKNTLLKKYEQNEKIHQEKLREKYNPNDIFKKSVPEVKLQENVSSTNEFAMVIKKESLFKKWLNKIKNIFHII